MIAKLLIALSMLALCVAVHAVGTTAASRWVRNRVAHVEARFWLSTWMLVRMAGAIVCLHILEIAVWAFYYSATGAMPDFHAALYFSAVTYTTTGYGDLLLPDGWRLVGGVEALTGILMCGWSAAFFFAVVNRIHQVSPR